MAAALECWSGRPSTDEDMVEQVLMKTHDRSEAYHSAPRSSSTPTSPSPASSSSSASTSSASSKNFSGSTALPPKKWQRIGRNFAGAISALKNSLNLDSLRDQMTSGKASGGGPGGAPPATSVRAFWGGVVRSLSEMYPGCQLPEKLISDVRRHFDSLPNIYAHAGHDIKDVLLHLRLIEQAAAEDIPALHIQELPDDDGGGTLFQLTFASTAPISWQSMSGSLDTSAIICKKIQIYEKKSLTLGILTLLVHHGAENFFRARVDVAVRSAVVKRHNNKTGGGSGGGGVKLHFGGLCGCQEEDGGASWEVLDAAAEDEPAGNVFTGVQLPRPLPESLIVVSVDERQVVRSGGEELGRWLLNPDHVEIGDRVGPNSFNGWYRGKRAWVKRLKGCDRGNAYEIEVRRGLLEFMNCGHRNILHVHGVCVDAAQGLCVVSRLMEGGSVHDASQRGKKMASRDVMRVALDVAEGLRFMNDHGVTYRDLNAQRILLDKQGNACLADMGAVTACRSASEITEYETAGYRWLAPEIIAGDPETVSETSMSNAYSFGMLIWEMLTGEAAYSSYSPVQAAVGIAACGLRPEIPTDCPPILRSLMHKCWNGNPCQRPSFPDIVAVLSRHSTR